MPEHGFPSVPGFRLLRVIGHGGMSTVYLAEQESLGRKVALKVMLPEALADETSRARFENEARTIGRLDHPNIMRIFEVGRSADGLPFYSMPYLSHGHLGKRRLAGDQPAVAALLRTLLDALDYAHVRGVVHRDVKAENVLFDEADRPLLGDFGIARQRGRNPRLTTVGIAVGSTAYMPPEQARGRDVDRRADLYSLGVLGWELLVGQLPFDGGDALEMALHHLHDPLPTLPRALRHWQPFFERVMAKEPRQRPASAQEMRDALDALERRAGSAFVAIEPPALPLPTVVGARSTLHRRVTMIAATGLVLAAALGSWWWWTSRRAELSENVSKAATLTATTPAENAPAAAPPQVTDAPDALAASPAGHAGTSAYAANARQQIADGHLIAPANGNAWDSVDMARRVAPTAPETMALVAALFDALADASEQALTRGDAPAARGYFERAAQLDQRRGGSGESLAILRRRLDQALEVRVGQLLREGNREAATGLLGASGWLALNPTLQRALQARVREQAATPVVAAKAAAESPRPAMVAEIITVGRADYARFAAGTGRAPADCGTGVFGRKLRWNNVGNDRKPVTCVSAADAIAYAAWRAGEDGHRYRLPTAGELRALPPAPVAGWLNLCGDHACALRMASGKSQPLESGRGYEDVGIRIARLD